MDPTKKLRRLAEELVQPSIGTVPTCDDIVNSLDYSLIDKERDESFITAQDTFQVSVVLKSMLQIPEGCPDIDEDLYEKDPQLYDELCEKGDELHEKTLEVANSEECKNKIAQRIKTEFFPEDEVIEGETQPNYYGKFQHYYFEVYWTGAEIRFPTIDVEDGKLFYEVEIEASAKGGYSGWDSIL